MKEKPPILRTLVAVTLFAGVFVYLIPYILLSFKLLNVSFTFGNYRYLGILPFVIGASIALYSVKDFVFRGFGTPAPMDPPKRLVVSGPFKYVRNPIYVGLFLLIFGETLFFSSIEIALYLLILITVFHFVVILYEEPKLLKTFGSEYEKYCKDVNRWAPNVF